MNRIRVLIIMLLSISGCDSNDFETSYNFSGNGKLFSLDFGEDGQSKIGIYDTSGALEREIVEDNGHARFGKFIGENFFYVVNNADFTTSRVMKCSLDFECSVFYSTNGIISCLFQFADRLNFYYETPKGNVNSINYQIGFRIVSVDFSGKNPQVRYSDLFYYTVCPVELGKQVLISASFQGRSDFIFKDKIAIIREDYKLEEFF